MVKVAWIQRSVKGSQLLLYEEVCAVNCYNADTCNVSVSSDADLKHLVAGPAGSRRSCGLASLILGYPGCTLGREEVSM